MGEHLPCKQGVKSSNLFISIDLSKQSLSQEIFENYTVKENGSFSENKAEKVTETFVEYCRDAIRSEKTVRENKSCMIYIRSMLVAARTAKSV